jgi:hypothetical protein
MSLGEDRVRIQYGPKDNPVVSEIKGKTAALIDLCNLMSDKTEDPEIGRCLSLAMTHYEDAAMWAVKAATS